MSYGYMAWAVDIDKLKEVCGSKDEKLVRMICGRFKHDVADLDDTFDYLIRSGAPTARQALTALIDGAEMVGHGAMYAYAFKLLVEHFGKSLDNSALYPTGLEFPGEVDKVLKAGGVTVISLSGLSYGSAPVKFPSPDDFPRFGHLTAEQVKQAQRQLQAFTYDGNDYDTTGAIANLRSWVDTASASGRGIMAFFH